MRIWDIHPGYLNRSSLLGEHRELHGIYSIIHHGKKGYSQHPETKRWVNHLPALCWRHFLLACEMRIRGYNEKTPLPLTSIGESYPHYVDKPQEQYKILTTKYMNKPMGRIPLPKNVQELWRQHKYSVLARDEALYRHLGVQVAHKSISFDRLANLLATFMRQSPSPTGIENALDHMWGYVKTHAKQNIDKSSLSHFALAIAELIHEHSVSYVWEQTAISDLLAHSFFYEHNSMEGVLYDAV